MAVNAPVIKAIETVFDGHRFRSRLEARWAVFFKTVGLSYEYELEGYDLGDGVQYLPDFFLKDMKVHVEVKPNRDLSEKDIEKMVRFSIDHDKKLLLIIGTPQQEEMFFLDRINLSPWSMYAPDPTHPEDLGMREFFFGEISPFAEVAFAHTIRGYSTLVYKTTPQLVEQNWHAALSKAKQARFEHGKSGN